MMTNTRSILFVILLPMIFVGIGCSPSIRTGPHPYPPKDNFAGLDVEPVTIGAPTTRPRRVVQKAIAEGFDGSPLLFKKVEVRSRHRPPSSEWSAYFTFDPQNGEDPIDIRARVKLAEFGQFESATARHNSYVLGDAWRDVVIPALEAGLTKSLELLTDDRVKIAPGITSFDHTEFLQMGFATVTLAGDELEEIGVEGTLDGIGQNLGEMMLEPRVIESTEDSRVWVVDLKNVLYAPETKDFETELPRTVAEGVPAPAVVKYTVKPNGFCQGTTHIPKGSPLRDDPIATQYLNMIPLGTLWYGKR
jgi:hypothetical protein